MKKHTLSFLCFFYCAFFVHLQAQEYTSIIENHFSNLVEKDLLLPQDVDWEITSQHISSTSGINHIYFNQTLNGIHILNTQSSIHLYPNGEELESNNFFIKECSKKIIGSSAASISSKKAVEFAANHLNYTVKTPLTPLKQEQGVSKKTLFSGGGFSAEDIPIQLKYWQNEDKQLVLVWEMSILENSFEHNWNVFVDASSGTIVYKYDSILNCSFENNSEEEKPLNYNDNLILKSNFTISSGSVNGCENCYEVIPFPLESPYFSERSIVVDPKNELSSPYGWHDVDGLPGPEFLTTTGNNIDVFIASELNNGYQPNGTSSLNFSNYPFDKDFSIENRYEDASITNLFYWGNIFHDVIYQYGFDEASGNFQENNYDKGGLGSDPMIIRGQYKLDVCNAKYMISSEGSSPRISMYACGDKDGGFDNTVVTHEYAHGISTRLTGGSFIQTCLFNNEGLGEGISDWYGLMLTMSPGDIGSRPRGYATYLFDQGPSGDGIRLYKYSTDMNVNPQTYDYIKTNSSVHQVGAIWGTILWDLTWALMDVYGYDEDIYNFTGDVNKDAGNIMALAIITEALKIQPCFPGFINGRNAILSANTAIYGGGNNCILWDAFAKRGLGYNATQGSPFITDDGEEDFESVPRTALLELFRETVCSNSSIFTELGGGMPPGGVYGGPGVIDDGNGETYSFDPLIAGIGIHSISYEIQASYCTEASVIEKNIEVLVDTMEPELICSEDITVTIPLGKKFYTIIDFSDWGLSEDNCFAAPVVTQRPVAGTPVKEGEVIMKMKSTDNAGNNVSCSFVLTIEKEKGEILEKIEIYPNPVKDEIIISSNTEIDVLTVSVMDINKRLLINGKFLHFGLEKKLSLDRLISGIYFLKIKSEKSSVIKTIIKE